MWLRGDAHPGHGHISISAGGSGEKRGGDLGDGRSLLRPKLHVQRRLGFLAAGDLAAPPAPAAVPGRPLQRRLQVQPCLQPPSPLLTTASTAPGGAAAQRRGCGEARHASGQDLLRELLEVVVTGPPQKRAAPRGKETSASLYSDVWNHHPHARLVSSLLETQWLRDLSWHAKSKMQARGEKKGGGGLPGGRRPRGAAGHGGTAAPRGGPPAGPSPPSPPPPGPRPPVSAPAPPPASTAPPAAGSHAPRAHQATMMAAAGDRRRAPLLACC